MADPGIGAAVFTVAGAGDPAAGMSRSMDVREALRAAIGAAQGARTSVRNVARVGTQEAVRGWALYDAGTDRAQQRAFRLVTDLADALRRPGELRLHYQPRICLRSGRCVGAEALLRWDHPVLGAVGPAEFIPLVEESALPGPLTDWVLEAALQEAADWHRTGLNLNLSINVSALNLEEADFVRRIERAMERHGVAADRIELEFTEGSVLREGGRALRHLHALRRLGLGIAIDDFGTGYSNLTYLRELPAGVLKLDKSFVGAIEGSERDRTIVRSTITMAHDLGYRVVAEGVETPGTRDLLAGWDCEEAQGFLFSRPVSGPDLRVWLGKTTA